MLARFFHFKIKKNFFLAVLFEMTACEILVKNIIAFIALLKQRWLGYILCGCDAL